MNPLSDGVEIDAAIHTQVLTNKLVQATMREAQMEAAIQTLIVENKQLVTKVEHLAAQVPKDNEEKADASAK